MTQATETAVTAGTSSGQAAPKKGWPLGDQFVANNIRVLLTKTPALMVWAYDGEYNGKKTFNIREVYMKEDEKWYPSQRGFSVSEQKRDAFLQAVKAQLK